MTAIRQVGEQDIVFVREIAVSSSNSSGISFPLTLEQYSERLNPLFFVAVDGDNHPIGFVMFMQSGLCRSLVEEARYRGVGAPDLELLSICLPDRILDSGGDQEVAIGASIAVHPKHRRRGVAKQLLRHVLSEMSFLSVQKAIAPIRHKPKRNVASISLCESEGFSFSREEEVQGTLWGIYSTLIT